MQATIENLYFEDVDEWINAVEDKFFTEFISPNSEFVCYYNKDCKKRYMIPMSAVTSQFALTLIKSEEGEALIHPLLKRRN